jgi:hypothetical protein
LGKLDWLKIDAAKPKEAAEKKPEESKKGKESVNKE